MAFDFGGAWIVEQTTSFFFSDNKAKAVLM
jgi:hypothetical protein